MFCRRCSTYFQEQGLWQRICKDCYRQEKENELFELRDEIAWLRTQLSRKPPPPPPAPPLTEEFLRKLLMLTHPDKHAGSTLANEVTRRLLEMRDRVRSTA